MQETGVDAFVDVHGDEELPFNFLSGSEGTLNWGPRLKGLHGAFCAAYCRANSDMQAKVGYLPPPPGRRAAPNIATNAIADRFDCLSVTLEMPFKDCLSNPNPAIGWSPNRASLLGASLIDALVYVSPHLRASGEFWNLLPPEDTYIPPTRSY
jgi:murein tripeptide amidase MpaA